MNKQEIIEKLKHDMLDKFQENGKHKDNQYRKNIYDFFLRLDESYDYELILNILNYIYNVVGIKDDDISDAINYISAEQKLIELMDEKVNKGYYDASDIVLVRVTDFLPIGGGIPSISNVPFVCKPYLSTYNAIYSYYLKSDEILKKLNDAFDKEQDFQRKIVIQKEIKKREEVIKEMVLKNTPYATQYRSTIHFCLNGLVSSHMYGDFNGKFVIIEPFIFHEDDLNIDSVRPEDTYFKENITLSSKAVIMVNEDDKKEIEEYIDIKKYNIVFYRGDKQIAVNNQLIKMGIIPEKIGEHGLRDSDTSSYIYDFIKNKKYQQEKHCYSNSYKEDDKKSLELWHMYELEFYNYLLKFVGNFKDKDLLIEIINDINRYYSERLVLEELLIKIIEEIGIEKYSRIVNEFNTTILNKIQSNNYPTNNEILESFSCGVHHISRCLHRSSWQRRRVQTAAHRRRIRRHHR